MEHSDVVIGGSYVFNNSLNQNDVDNGAVVVVTGLDDFPVKEWCLDFVISFPDGATGLADAKELSPVEDR